MQYFSSPRSSSISHRLQQKIIIISSNIIIEKVLTSNAIYLITPHDSILSTESSIWWHEISASQRNTALSNCNISEGCDLSLLTPYSTSPQIQWLCLIHHQADIFTLVWFLGPSVPWQLNATKGFLPSTVSHVNFLFPFGWNSSMTLIAHSWDEKQHRCATRDLFTGLWTLISPRIIFNTQGLLEC